MKSLRDLSPLLRNFLSIASYSDSVRRICIYRLCGSISAISILSFHIGVQGVSLLQAVYWNIQFLRNCNAEIPSLLGLICPLRGKVNLSLRLCKVSSLRRRNWSFATSAAIPPHLSTAKFEKSGKKSANVHKKFTIRFADDTTFRTLCRFIPNLIDAHA